MTDSNDSAPQKKLETMANPIPVPKSEPSPKNSPADDASNQVMDAIQPAGSKPEAVKEKPAETAGQAANPPEAKPPRPSRPSDDRDDSDGDGRDSKPLHPEVKPHAFVVMPFGNKKGADSRPYDFNAIYKQLIKPAIEDAGFEPFRADEETASGDILTDMFQELLLADMVVCDLSIDNANAFYELGIRHALRKRGVVHVQAGRAYMPFDIFNVRTLPYHITDEGLPDTAFLKNDIKSIARLIRDTWKSDRDRIHSPIYNLLGGLKEPDRKSLQTPLATGFWREYDEWKDRVTVAQRDKHIGDILLLTEEIKNPFIREDAVAEVGSALAKLGRYELALNQYREGIEVNPSNLDFRREEAFHLNRVGRVNESIVRLENILKDFPEDNKSLSYLGRIYKDMWTNSWNKIQDKNKRLKQAFNTYHWLIQSIDIYMKGFQSDLREYYPAINAFTLSTIAMHLADKFDSKKTPDPDITRIRQSLPGLKSALRFCLDSKLAIEQEKTDYWALVSLAELRLLTSNDLGEVVRSYRKAVTALRRDLFSLRSSLQQLETIKALGIRTEFTQTCIALVKEEIRHASTGDTSNIPLLDNRPGSKAAGGRALIFTGYMVDYQGKDKKFFPADKQNEIKNEIRKRVEKFKPTPRDRAFLAGLSAGSEIIFAEACAEAGMKVKVFLPHTEAKYSRNFIIPAGQEWQDRFYAVRSHPLVDEIYQPEHLGPPKEGDNVYERNGRWAIYSALGRVGIENMRMIAFANEFVGDTKDRDILLTRYMIELMRNLGGRIAEFINPSKYIYNVINSALESLIEQGDAKSAKKANFGKRVKKPAKAQ
jgi:tetratricopeptide (TPR) repeat protein